MTDIDREIQADVHWWQDHELTSPPDLDRAMAAALSGTGRRAHTRRRAAVIASVAATVTIVVAAATSVQLVRESDSAANSATQSASPAFPGSTAVSQPPTRLMNLGAVKWGAPVVSASDQRVVYLEQLDVPSGICDDQISVIKTHVTESAKTVRIRLDGYGAQPVRTQVCDLLPNHLQPKITLRAPLNGRPLVDDTNGKTHAAYDPASAPRFTETPLGCAVQDPLQWTPATDTAHILCEDDNADVEAQIWYAPVGAWDHEFNTPGGAQGAPATIHGARAQVWYDSSTPTWTLQWTIETGRQVVLMVLDRAGKALDRKQVVTLARSIRNPSK
ncbi:hypothetical protein [uncultured Jatrophihabitans sp.]|uniref:hypothetical protein n=1 Tax=uncultured Jatrophihabitans sp. TaxID=1610747 RepID=UPI0035CBE33F